MRKLRYLGQKPLPIRLEMPWLSEPVTIDGEGLCLCPNADAEGLLKTNPNMFFDMGEAIEAKPPIEVPTATKPMPTRKKKAKKE